MRQGTVLRALEEPKRIDETASRGVTKDILLAGPHYPVMEPP